MVKKNYVRLNVPMLIIIQFLWDIMNVQKRTVVQKVHHILFQKKENVYQNVWVQDIIGHMLVNVIQIVMLQMLKLMMMILLNKLAKINLE